MTAERLALAELMEKAGDGDFLRAVAEAVLQLLMETDVEGLIGVARHERSPDRPNYRNGYRDRTLDTRLGTLALRVPKLRQGSYFPPFQEPRRMTEKALAAVIQEAWTGDVPRIGSTTSCSPFGRLLPAVPSGTDQARCALWGSSSGRVGGSSPWRR